MLAVSSFSAAMPDIQSSTAKRSSDMARLSAAASTRRPGEKSANSVLIKLNQIGTVSETEVTAGDERTVVTVELAADPTDLRFVSVVLVEPGAVVEVEPEGVAR